MISTCRKRCSALLLAPIFLAACSDGNDSGVAAPAGPTLAEATIYSVANQCFQVAPLGTSDFLAGGASILLRPSDLGKYLLYTQDNKYLVADAQQLAQVPALAADTRLVEDEVVIEDRKQSEGEWLLEDAADGGFHLQHILSGNYIAADGSLSDSASAAALDLVPAEGCATFPELSVDASGQISKTEFEDGDVFGFVETHSHLFTNQAFGGGGAFHGAPFHPLGVEHALPDCELTHGPGGRRDFIGFAFNGGLNDLDDLLPLLLNGELPEDDHITDGYPEFTEWPAAPFSGTHQMQYYTWIERAWLSGLRLMVQHATTGEVLCQIAVGIGALPLRHDCNDMVAVDRIIEATYDLERYIDALAGGPGKGWFRIVFNPEQAREEIRKGNLAVVLGIETSDLFDCFLVPFDGFKQCTEEDVIAKLDEYHDKGVRVLFPVHKLDNGFSAGDGDRRISDIGNFAHTGHFTNFTECPEELLTFPGGFDKGGVNFGGLNQPREVYDSPPPADMSNFDTNPIGALAPYLPLLTEPPLEGEYCQNHGLTDLGEFLMREMMKRGMIMEVDHFPRRSYARAYEILEEYDYPAIGSHGRNNNGRLYQLGGMSKSGFGRCRAEGESGAMSNGFLSRFDQIRAAGGYVSEGFGFDLNGFAGAPGPRFGERANCSDDQTDPGVTYPFTSYAGDVTFSQPVVGNRSLDFNTEGMVHLGLVAELIEDARLDGVSDADLEPLFRSAEGYIRVWEKSEARAQSMAP